LGISANAWGQPEMAALDSLKMLAIKAQEGASYNNYAQELATTKSKVKLFLKSPDAKNEMKLAQAMRKALEHYDFAMLVWQRARKRKELESESSRMNHYAGWNLIKKRKERKESLQEKEEEARLKSMGKSTYYLDKVKDSDILQTMSARYLNKFIITKDETPVDELLPVIWQRASHEVQNAAAAFQKQIQTVKKADVVNITEGDSLVTEIGPDTRPRRRRYHKRREVIEPPPAPALVKEESPEQLPVDGSVMRMVNPAIHDQD
jgi:hypothetical protein